MHHQAYIIMSPLHIQVRYSACSQEVGWVSLLWSSDLRNDSTSIVWWHRKRWCHQTETSTVYSCTPLTVEHTHSTGQPLPRDP